MIAVDSKYPVGVSDGVHVRWRRTIIKVRLGTVNRRILCFIRVCKLRYLPAEGPFHGVDRGIDAGQAAAAVADGALP